MPVTYGRDTLSEKEFLECVPEGWREIAKPLYPVFDKNDISIAQIKEKFGTLRVYVDSATDKVYDLIDEIEDKSATVCMYCGEPGVMRTGGYWIQVSCDKCLAED